AAAGGPRARCWPRSVRPEHAEADRRVDRRQVVDILVRPLEAFQLPVHSLVPGSLRVPIPRDRGLSRRAFAPWRGAARQRAGEYWSGGGFRPGSSGAQMVFERARPGIAGVLILAVAGCGGGGSVAGPAPAPSAAPLRRPNIVFLLTDDLDVRTSDMMPRLPALIGQHGLTFTRAYVTQSLCAPSRASILTGQYPHNHRVLDNTGPDGGFPA